MAPAPAPFAEIPAAAPVSPVPAAETPSEPVAEAAPISETPLPAASTAASQEPSTEEPVAAPPAPGTP
jgi:hypothetical protein